LDESHVNMSLSHFTLKTKEEKTLCKEMKPTFMTVRVGLHFGIIFTIAKPSFH